MDSVIAKLIVRKLRSLYKTFSRKKVMDAIQDTPLTKVLSILDLIASGVSSILPSNIYLANKFLETSGVGPAVIISIAIAAITSIFAGLCYAELSARMPRAGSAYIYSYVSMGEFLAFLMGWILILDYAINSVTIISSLSMSIDRFYNDDILKTKDFFLLVSFNVNSLSSSDFIAFSVTLIITAVLILGTKKSSKMSNVFTFMNLSVILLVTIVGSLKADFSNWTTVNNCTETFLHRFYKFRKVGSMPCGIYMADVILGVFRCFHIFVSFDCLATLGEEAKNPRQSIPIAIISTLIITFFVYFSFSIMLALQPYYNQELESLFRLYTIEWKCRWLVMFNIGMISGLCANLLGSIFSLSRVIYAMASDGLIFKWMGNINSQFQTPIMGTLCATLLIGILVIISWYNPWSMDTIIICKLRTYCIVASCVIILRYEESEVYDREVDHNSRNFVFIIKQLINANKLNHSTKLTAHIVNVLVFFYVILCLCTATLLSKYVKKINDPREIEIKKARAFVTPLVTLAAILVIILIFIHFQPVSKKRLAFSVPLIPFLPGFSILINMFFMMLMLDTLEIWTIFFVWIAIGLGIYFLYGIRHSHI